MSVRHGMLTTQRGGAAWAVKKKNQREPDGQSHVNLAPIVMASLVIFPLQYQILCYYSRCFIFISFFFTIFLARKKKVISMAVIDRSWIESISRTKALASCPLLIGAVGSLICCCRTRANDIPLATWLDRTRQPWIKSSSFWSSPCSFSHFVRGSVVRKHAGEREPRQDHKAGPSAQQRYHSESKEP